MVQIPDVMPAAVFMGIRDVSVEDRPTPLPGPGELLLEVSHCGVCGSDLHFLLEWGGHEGAIEGHEYSGTIVAVGDAVTDWQPGERVVGGLRRRAIGARNGKEEGGARLSAFVATHAGF